MDVWVAERAIICAASAQFAPSITVCVPHRSRAPGHQPSARDHPERHCVRSCRRSRRREGC